MIAGSNNHIKWRERLQMAGTHYAFGCGLLPVAFATLSAAHFSRSLTSRFVHGTGLPRDVIIEILSSIRSAKSWPVVWRNAAEMLETSGRQLLEKCTSAEGRREGVHTLRHAALFYHYAQIILGPKNSAEKDYCEQKAQALYRETALDSSAPAVRVEIPFRGTFLPGYLRRPPLEPGQKSQELKGLIIFCNGADSIKEEGHRLCHPFLRDGYATFVFDGPGEGEALPRIKGITKQEDVAKAVIDHLQKEYPSLPEKIILFGISLGGMKALMMAAGEPRISAVVSVSAPFDTRWYFKDLNPLAQNDVIRNLGNPTPAMINHLIASCVLDKFAGKIKKPVFSAGGKHDSVLPYREAERIIHALPPGKNHKLKFYDAGHGCLDSIGLLLNDVRSWLADLPF
jgi:2,6-dihydroxypseudooxynicotine hydrolase